MSVFTPTKQAEDKPDEAGTKPVEPTSPEQPEAK